MLYYLSEFTDWFSPLRMFQYITFRAIMASGTAFVMSLTIGPGMIRLLRRWKIGQQVRGAEAQSLSALHGKKQGTPTMGGLLIIASVTLSGLLWAVPTNRYVWLALGTCWFMGGIGFLDDYLKMKKRQSKGLGARSKLALQTLWVVAVGGFLFYDPDTAPLARNLMLPFVKVPVLTSMSLAGSLIFLWFVMVGATNAVNLTDGLDGLAIGCSNSVALCYLVMSYVAGHFVFADYLQVPFIQGAGELAVLCAALLGAGLGFLWFNCHPAKVFMGDTGSLALGGMMAMIAILIQQEIVLVIVGGVFVMEALSVVIQVAWFKCSGGRRVFLCAPIHHHFELYEKQRAEKEGRDLEVVETMITIRFWILSIIFALLGIATLKIR